MNINQGIIGQKTVTSNETSMAMSANATRASLKASFEDLAKGLWALWVTKHAVDDDDGDSARLNRTVTANITIGGKSFKFSLDFGA